MAGSVPSDLFLGEPIGCVPAAGHGSPSKLPHNGTGSSTMGHIRTPTLNVGTIHQPTNLSAQIPIKYYERTPAQWQNSELFTLTAEDFARNDLGWYSGGKNGRNSGHDDQLSDACGMIAHHTQVDEVAGDSRDKNFKHEDIKHVQLRKLRHCRTYHVVGC